MAPFAEYRYHHSSLGEIIGLARGHDVVQFRGLPFADIPGRFRQSRLRETLPRIPFDARQPGPYCPQPPLPFPSYWSGGLPPGCPALSMPPQDEFGCLNLTITTPRAVLEDNTAAKLPVLFFIHGGAFIGGSQSVQVSGREIYDGTGLERAAITRGQPLIIVTCNYRVGPLGFLTSKELAVFNKSHSEPVGNYGLHDQRQALEWCAKFIAGFGGDPENVTIQGTSAGGSSAHYLATFPHRRFKRAILSSGTFTGIGPMARDYHQLRFDKYLEKATTEASTSSGADPVHLVQSLPIQDMTQPVTPDVWHPSIDGEWIAGQRLADVNPDVYDGGAPDIMVGACDFEADITLAILQGLPPSPHLSDPDMLARAADLFLSNGMVAHLGASFPSIYPHLAEAYGIAPDALTSPSKALDPWAQLLADVAFRVPALHLAQHITRSRQTTAGKGGSVGSDGGGGEEGGKVYVYDMRVTNPYPEWEWAYGKANHAINDLFVFDVAADQVPEGLRARYELSVAQVRGKWLDFCYGKRPWGAVQRDGDGLGPVFSFENGEEGRESATLEEAVGDEVAKRWRLLLKIAESPKGM